MLVCYVDEAGNIGVYQPSELTSTPVFVVAGVSVDVNAMDELLMDYIHLKTRFEPSLRRRQFSDVIKYEVKGVSLRRDLRNLTSRDTRRRAMGYLGAVVSLLEQYRCRIMGRVLVKQLDVTYEALSTYPSAIAELAETFDNQAAVRQDRGWMILDSQTKVKNEGNVHTITTRRYRHGGNLFPQLVESPVFGHSDTHVLLQLADIVASALVYPCACAAYLSPVPGDPHRDPVNQIVRTAFGTRLAALEYRYTNPDGGLRGGFYILGNTSRQSSRSLFRQSHWQEIPSRGQTANRVVSRWQA